MARELVGFFKRWCSSIKVDSYEKLSDLIVLEQFKYILPERLATFMCEHKVETAAQAAILADEYVLTHKSRNRDYSQSKYQYSRDEQWSNRSLVDQSTQSNQNSQYTVKQDPSNRR